MENNPLTTALTTALRSKLGYMAKQVSGSDHQLRLLGSHPPQRMGDMLVFMDHMFEWIDRKAAVWTGDYSKYYLKHGNPRRLVFAWRFIFQSSSSLTLVLPDIINAVNAVPRSTRSEIMEMPLVGASVNRNNVVRGKGAGFTDQHRTGPLALAGK